MGRVGRRAQCDPSLRRAMQGRDCRWDEHTVSSESCRTNLFACNLNELLVHMLCSVVLSFFIWCALARSDRARAR